MQPADSQLYKIQRSVLDVANPLIKAFELLQQEEEELIFEVSKAVRASLHLLGGANAHLTTRRKGALSKMKPQWADLAKEKFPEAKRNLFGEGLEQVVERRAKTITALKKTATLGASSTPRQFSSFLPIQSVLSQLSSDSWVLQAVSDYQEFLQCPHHSSSVCR